MCQFYCHPLQQLLLLSDSMWILELTIRFSCEPAVGVFQAALDGIALETVPVDELPGVRLNCNVCATSIADVHRWSTVINWSVTRQQLNNQSMNQPATHAHIHLSFYLSFGVLKHWALMSVHICVLWSLPRNRNEDWTQNPCVNLHLHILRPVFCPSVLAFRIVSFRR